MQLSNSTIFVSGGSSGLGKACVERLVQAGANVVIADLNEQEGEALCNALGEATRFVRTDVTSPSDVEQAVKQATDAFGSLHGVVSCAGILGAARVVGRKGPHDLDLFRRVVEVNLIGTFNVLRCAAAAMSQNDPDDEGERGVIVNTSSVAAFEGQIGQAAYAASKGGVASMTLPIARELASSGIRVVAIAPGIFRTPMMDAAPPLVLESLEQQTVFPKRLGEPADFAALVQHVFENPMLNGETIRLDGAVRMGLK
jgi:NAD(P)-dependent dehydrogenase (short-subunit alcohol dehydrogenase family)